MKILSPVPLVPNAFHKTALSVNVNKVALLRNTRHLDIPSVRHAAELCLEAGAQGITVHPRPDERHIRPDDVFELAALMKDWPDREFNIEGNPFQNLMGFVHDLAARGLPLHQCTFVPDSEDQFTSDHGWNFPEDAERLRR
jgi:pyridoxine 5-phosphate synthase